MSSSTPSEATAFDKFSEAFKEYASMETGTISLKKFHASSPTFFVTNSDNIKNLRSAWNLSFTKAVKELEIEDFDNDQPDWYIILQQVMERLEKSNSKGKSPISVSPSKSQSSLRTTSSPGSSFKTTHLSPKDWESFERKFNAMDNASKWEIEPGVFVEDKVYQHAKTIPYEHAAHSFILNLADSRWQSVFTPSQLVTIEQYGVASLARIPSKMAEFFDKFKGIDDIDDLLSIADDTKFHYVNDFDAGWSKRCIIDILTAYHFNVIKKIARYGKERDIIMRVWKAIDIAFDDLDVDISRSDQLSAASSARVNEDRVAENGDVKSKILGVKLDMIVSKDMLEYATAEHGYYDEAGIGSKENVEKFLKLPKTMKDMLLMLHKELGNKEKYLRALRVIGLSHTHLRMSAFIMDAPAGYICRVKPMQEQKIPMTLTRFHETYIPFLMQVYKLKHVIKESIKVTASLQSSDDAEELSGFVSVTSHDGKVLVLPSALNVTPPTTSKKRKASELEADAK